jgi:fatty-acid desaturase
MYGKRPLHSDSQATNNSWLVYLVLGEGLHGTHHMKPTKGVLGNWHADLTGTSLRVLERSGLIWELRR